MPDPIFFFSYARADYDTAGNGQLNGHDDGNFVDAFFQQISREVAQLTAQDSRTVGFYDRRSLDLGSPWPGDLLDGLRKTTVMVSLFSPTYFSREACGREFEIYRRRHEALCNSLGRPADFRILPVLWVRPDVTYKSIPACCRTYVSAIQNRAPEMPEVYPRIGLSRMFKLAKDAELHAVAIAIADRIFELASRHDESLPVLESEDFNEVPSAFHSHAIPAGTRPIDPARREMRVFYLVPTRGEWLLSSGTEAHELDEKRENARPFRDAPGATVRHATEEGISQGGLNVSVMHEELPEDLAAALASTRDTQTSPLIVFDRRAITVPPLRKRLDQYLAHNFSNAGFITAAGGMVPDSQIGAVCGLKMGALPKLHNWTVPSGRGPYVHNVAEVAGELECKFVGAALDSRPDDGAQIPGLNGPGRRD